MPKRGRRRKKSRTHVSDNTATEAANSEKMPKSLVLRKGKTAPELGELVDDLRRLMMPYTALNFQDDPKNRKLTLQQYCTSLALPMGITHILQLSQNDDRCNMRLARMPEGPVMSFRVHRFSLTRHVQTLQKRPVAFTPGMSTNAAVVVTNNFGDHTAPPHVKLMRITFQNLFPQINVASVKLKDCRRVVLFNLVKDGDGDSAKDIVDIRHYAVRATPTGVNRRIRRLVQAKKLPNLNQVKDIADYLSGNAVLSDAPSDSEPEDAVVELSDNYVGKGNTKKQKSALKLVELGPRLSLELIKVEKGLNSNHSACLYHSYVSKSPAEVAALTEKHEKAAALKRQRTLVQEANVERKMREHEEKRVAKRQRLAERDVRMQSLDPDRIEGVSNSSESSDDEV